jgi:hypothetical protein
VSGVANRAAFSPDDVGDAKRGRPAVALTDYAAARGLEFLDHATVAGYRAALPGDAAFQANVLRGALPGGGYGILAHEAIGVPLLDGGGLTWSAPFYGLEIKGAGGPGAGRLMADFALALVPGGDLFTGLGGSAPDTAPVRVPATVAAMRVPETAPVAPFLRLDTHDEAPPYDFGNRARLDELGLPGWSVQSNPAVDAAFLAELLAEPVGATLRARTGDALFQVIVAYATVAAHRNGYRADPAALDDQAATVSLLAARLREVCLRRVQRQPWEQALPAPAWVTGGDDSPFGFDAPPEWRVWASQTAATYGLELEDPVAYHRAYPSLPVPGFARVVMRGTLRGLGLQGRLVVHFEPGGARAAVLVGLPAGAPHASAPDGDNVHTDPPARLEIRDGIAAVWSRTSYWGNRMAGDLDALLAAAASVLVPRR